MMDTVAASSTGGHDADQQPALCYGVVSACKKNFGFIKHKGSRLNTFFHFTELRGLEASHVAPGLEVCFTMGADDASGRPGMQAMHVLRCISKDEGSVGGQWGSSSTPVSMCAHYAWSWIRTNPSKRAHPPNTTTTTTQWLETSPPLLQAAAV